MEKGFFPFYHKLSSKDKIIAMGAPESLCRRHSVWWCGWKWGCGSGHIFYIFPTLGWMYRTRAGFSWITCLFGTTFGGLMQAWRPPLAYSDNLWVTLRAVVTVAGCPLQLLKPHVQGNLPPQWTLLRFTKHIWRFWQLLSFSWEWTHKMAQMP